MIPKHQRRFFVTAVSVFATAAVGQPASAQTADETPFDLGTIVLGARLIDERLLEVPFGLSVLTTGDVGDRRVIDPVDLSRVTPGLNLGDTGLRGSNIPNIRGVGSFTPLSADDASVPVFIDGIPLPVRSQERELFDVERVEVLRGPQNTLYGRNAQAGAINITSTMPSFTPELGFGFEVGSEDHAVVSAFASGPLTNNLAGRIALRFRNQGPYVQNDGPGADFGDEQVANVAASLLWQPSDVTEARMTMRYENFEGRPSQGVYLEGTTFPRAWVEALPSYETESLGFGLTVEHRFDNGVRFTSVTGMQDYQTDYFADDSDGYAFQALTGFPPSFADDPTSDFRTIRDDALQFSQEFRLDGEFAGGGNWVVGVNALRSDLDWYLRFNSTGFIDGEFNNDFSTESYAAFGEVTVPVTDRLRLIGGLRYTVETKTFDHSFTDLSGGALGFDNADSGEDDFPMLTGRLGLSFDLSEDVALFGTVARGAKAGGFQLVDTDLARGFPVGRYETAFTDTVELGVRGSVFDDRLYFSASAFYNETQNEHVQVFDIATFTSVVRNADTRSYGLELEAIYEATESWRFDGMVALLETEVTRSPDASIPAGNQLPLAPNVSFALGAEYSTDLTLFGQTGLITARANYSFVGDRQLDPQNRVVLDSFGVLDLRVGWQSGGTEIYAFVDNVFDETYAESGFFVGNTPTGGTVTAATPGDPRRIGIGANFRF